MVDTVSTQHPSQSAPWWMGAISGVAAAAVALAFGQFIEGVSDTMPGLVLGVGELIIDYTPGWAAEESIENLGTAGKGNLLLGITIVAFVLAGLLGEQALKRGDRFGVGGFFAFGLLGGWAAARNPQSSFIAGWFWASSPPASASPPCACCSTKRASTPTAGSPRRAEIAASPLEPPHSRRAFMRWTTGAGAVALTGVGVGRAVEGTGAGDLALATSCYPTQPPKRRRQRSPTAQPAPSAPNRSTSPACRVGSLLDRRPVLPDRLRPLVPADRPGHWRLSFTGMVDNPYELTYDEILNMDLVERTITLACVSNPIGGDYVGNAVWTGVSLADLLDRAGVQDGATQIVGRSVDDFTAGFPTETAYDGRNAMLVVGQNGNRSRSATAFPPGSWSPASTATSPPPNGSRRSTSPPGKRSTGTGSISAGPKTAR